MAVPVARVYLKVAHAALPALLPTPPKRKMLQFLPMPPCVAAAILPAKQLAKPSRADSDERWDAHKAKSASSAEPSASASSSLRPAVSIKNSARRGSFPKNATSPPPKPGRADAVERWDAHKKAAIASPSSSSSSGTSSLVSSKCSISRASSVERWDVHKKRRPSQAGQRIDDSDRSSTGSNDIDTEEEEEEILWKPRAMYAGPGFAAAAPEPRMLPLPTAFLVPVA